MEEVLVSNFYNDLYQYVKNGLNVLIVGPAGTGKTSIAKKVCSDLGMTTKYLDASLSDPYIDLVGIPVPNHEKKSMEFYKTGGLMDAEVIIIDELNRGPRDFRNGILEATLEHSLKGEKLDNLKSVIACMNPAEEGYQVDELDVALVDRFDVRLYFGPEIDAKYFSNKYNRDVAKAVKKWYKDYNMTNANKSSKNKKVYISPRRMDKLVNVFQKVPTLGSIKGSLPEGTTGNINGLFNDLNVALGFVKPEDVPKAKAKDTTAKKKSSITLKDIAVMDPKHIRNARRRDVQDALDASNTSDPDYKPAVDSVYKAIEYNIGGARLGKLWANTIQKHFSPIERDRLKITWGYHKTKLYEQESGMSLTDP